MHRRRLAENIEGPVHFEHIGAERVRSGEGLPPPQLKGCGERRKFTGDLWGEAAAANGIFVFLAQWNTF